MGRAFPRVVHFLPFVLGQRATPSAIVDSRGKAQVFYGADGGPVTYKPVPRGP